MHSWPLECISSPIRNPDRGCNGCEVWPIGGKDFTVSRVTFLKSDLSSLLPLFISHSNIVRFLSGTVWLLVPLQVTKTFNLYLPMAIHKCWGEILALTGTKNLTKAWEVA